MKMLAYGFLMLCAALLGAGCEQSAPPPVSTAPSHGYLDHAQATLPIIKLWLGKEEMQTEIASTLTQIQTGMMFRTNMAENEGMLFVFPEPYQASFYMKNTKVPLSCAYIDSEGTILEIHDLKPLDESPVSAATDRVQFVLETPQGWFQRHSIGIGVVVRSERGSLMDTFFRRRGLQ